MVVGIVKANLSIPDARSLTAISVGDRLDTVGLNCFTPAHA